MICSQKLQVFRVKNWGKHTLTNHEPLVFRGPQVVHPYCIAMWDWWCRKCGTKENERFIIITITACDQMCLKWLAYFFEDSKYFTNICCNNWKSCNEVLIRINWCLIDATLGTFERVCQLFAIDCASHVDVWTHLSTYYNCYVNKTLVLIFSVFLAFSQFFSILIPHCSIKFASLLSLTEWPINSETPCISVRNWKSFW